MIAIVPARGHLTIVDDRDAEFPYIPLDTSTEYPYKQLCKQ